MLLSRPDSERKGQPGSEEKISKKQAEAFAKARTHYIDFLYHIHSIADNEVKQADDIWTDKETQRLWQQLQRDVTTLSANHAKRFGELVKKITQEKKFTVVGTGMNGSEASNEIALFKKAVESVADGALLTLGRLRQKERQEDSKEYQSGLTTLWSGKDNEQQKAIALAVAFERAQTKLAKMPQAIALKVQAVEKNKEENVATLTKASFKLRKESPTIRLENITEAEAKTPGLIVYEADLVSQAGDEKSEANGPATIIGKTQFNYANDGKVLQSVWVKPPAEGQSLEEALKQTLHLLGKMGIKSVSLQKGATSQVERFNRLVEQFNNRFKKRKLERRVTDTDFKISKKSQSGEADGKQRPKRSQTLPVTDRRKESKESKRVEKLEIELCDMRVHQTKPIIPASARAASQVELKGGRPVVIGDDLAGKSEEKHKEADDQKRNTNSPT